MNNCECTCIHYRHTYADMWIQKKKRRSFILHKPWENQKVKREPKLWRVPVDPSWPIRFFTYQLALFSWHWLIYIKRIPCHFPGQTNWILGENTSKIFLIMLWPWKSANAIRTTFKKLPRIGGCRMWSQFTSLISDGKSQSVPHFSKFRCRNRSI